MNSDLPNPIIAISWENQLKGATLWMVGLHILLQEMQIVGWNCSILDYLSGNTRLYKGKPSEVLKVLTNLMNIPRKLEFVIKFERYKETLKKKTGLRNEILWPNKKCFLFFCISSLSHLYNSKSKRCVSFSRCASCIKHIDWK